MKKFRFNLIPDSSNLKFFRVLMLFFVFGACAYAYSLNFQSKIDKLNSIFIDDKFEILSEEDISKLNEIRISFKDRLGIGLDILVENNKKGVLIVPSFEPNEIFIGVNVARNEAVLLIPMLVKKAIGEGNRAVLEEDAEICLQDNTAFLCISELSYSLFDLITEQ